MLASVTVRAPAKVNLALAVGPRRDDGYHLIDAEMVTLDLADEVTDSILPAHPDATVHAGGSAMVYSQINSQNQHDLLLMESIALPLSFLVLVWVFGGLLAAALPLAVGGLAIVGTMSVLRLITFGTDVSIFALNLSTAMGLALAIDYTLLIISRYRDELADGADRDQAVIRTIATALAVPALLAAARENAALRERVSLIEAEALRRAAGVADQVHAEQKTANLSYVDGWLDAADIIFQRIEALIPAKGADRDAD